LKKSVTTFVITYNNGLADTIKNDQSQTKIFRGDGSIYEKLVFNNQAENEEKAEENTSEVSFRVSPFSFFQTNTL
jgi:hypothetical protein